MHTYTRMQCIWIIVKVFNHLVLAFVFSLSINRTMVRQGGLVAEITNKLRTDSSLLIYLINITTVFCTCLHAHPLARSLAQPRRESNLYIKCGDILPTIGTSYEHHVYPFLSVCQICMHSYVRTYTYVGTYSQIWIASHFQLASQLVSQLDGWMDVWVQYTYQYSYCASFVSDGFKLIASQLLLLLLVHISLKLEEMDNYLGMPTLSCHIRKED